MTRPAERSTRLVSVTGRGRMSRRHRLQAVAALSFVIALSSASSARPAFTQSRQAHVSAAVGATAADSSEPAGLDGGAYVDYPSSIAVLAHSGATGESSDPRRPRFEARENSWATGTNPAVDSVYRRILAKNPAIEGHNFNLAHGSANVRDLLRQAERAVARRAEARVDPRADHGRGHGLPGDGRDYATFRAGFISALEALAQGAPESSIFVVSQFGSPSNWRMLRPVERRRIGGTGPCAFLDPEGRVVPKELARLERIIHGYEAQLAAGCKTVRQCRYDGGAFGRIVDRRAYFSSDLNHLSVKNQRQSGGRRLDSDEACRAPSKNVSRRLMHETPTTSSDTRGAVMNNSPVTTRRRSHFLGPRNQMWGATLAKRSVVAAIAFIALTVMVAAGAMSAGAARSDLEHSSAHALVGSWDVTLLLPGLPPGRVLATFDGDGGTVESANAAPGLRGASHGAWERIAPNQFAVTTSVLQVQPADGRIRGHPAGQRHRAGRAGRRDVHGRVGVGAP